MLSWWYGLGRWLALHLPLPVSYWIASRLADLQYRRSSADRRAIQGNLTVVLGSNSPAVSRASREVFRNFAKYLIDFFRFETITPRFIAERVTLVGRHHLDAALRQGRGALLLSAHLGNYELGAAVAAGLGYPVQVVVLQHRDPRVDAFFTRQRQRAGVTPIAVGMALRQGFACLKRNQLLGILADRDFFNHGVRLPFLGRSMSVPRGPALFSVRTGAPIVPTFLVRDPGNRFRFIFEQPILPREGQEETAEVDRLMRASLVVLEEYIRRYPTQWYLFRDFENPGPWVIW